VKRLRQWALNSRLFAFNEVNRDSWVAQEAATVPPGSNVLDVGAGSCLYGDLFSHCDYKTQDFSQLTDSRQMRTGHYGKIDFISDVLEIPVADGSFDVVICTEVLEHVPEPIRLIKELARILRPNGRLILTAPLGSGIHQEPYHFYGGYTPYWYERFMPEYGFTNVKIEPNAGSFKFFSQEALRFLQSSRPFRLGMPVFSELIWLPVWLIAAPVLGLIVPLASEYLDRFDKERRFTVGYHVTAKKSKNVS